MQPPPPKACLRGQTRSAGSPIRRRHRLIRWAEAIGKAADMKQTLMDLYFTEGADLTDREVLAKAAGSIGSRCRRNKQASGERRRRRAGRTRSGAGQGSRHRRRAHVSSSAASSRCRARSRRNISPTPSSARRRTREAAEVMITRPPWPVRAIDANRRKIAAVPFRRSSGRLPVIEEHELLALGVLGVGAHAHAQSPARG